MSNHDIAASLRRIASRGRLDDMDVQEVFDAADEIDRLRAQVERDRPVIDAAEAWTQEWLIGGPDVFDLADDLREAVRERRTACAPDEVNQEGT